MASKTAQIGKLISAMGCLLVSVFIFRKRVRSYEIILSDLDFDLRKAREKESSYWGEQ